MAAYYVAYVLMKLVTLLSLWQQNLLLLNHHRVEQTIIEDTVRHFIDTPRKLLPKVFMPTVFSSVSACFPHIVTAPLEVWQVFYSVFMRIECIHIDAHIF